MELGTEDCTASGGRNGETVGVSAGFDCGVNPLPDGFPYSIFRILNSPLIIS